MPVTDVTAVLYFKNDAVQYLKDRPKVTAIYPLTPDAKAIILNNTEIPLFDPLHVFTDYSHRRVIASVRAHERSFHPIIENLNTISLAGKQTLKSLLHCSFSSYFYIRYMLRGTGPWLLYNGKDWVKTEKLYNATYILMQTIIKKRGKNVNKSNRLANVLLILIIIFINFCHKKFRASFFFKSPFKSLSKCVGGR